MQRAFVPFCPWSVSPFFFFLFIPSSFSYLSIYLSRQEDVALGDFKFTCTYTKYTAEIIDEGAVQSKYLFGNFCVLLVLWLAGWLAGWCVLVSACVGKYFFFFFFSNTIHIICVYLQMSVAVNIKCQYFLMMMIVAGRVAVVTKWTVHL